MPSENIVPPANLLLKAAPYSWLTAQLRKESFSSIQPKKLVGSKPHIENVINEENKNTRNNSENLNFIYNLKKEIFTNPNLLFYYFQ